MHASRPSMIYLFWRRGFIRLTYSIVILYNTVSRSFTILPVILATVQYSTAQHSTVQVTSLE